MEVLASHYLDAYRAVPDAEDADEIKVKARAMLTRAGDRAASLGAGREAQRYFQQAAELADDAVIRAELDDRAGRMAWRRGRPEEAVELFDRALAVFEAEGLIRQTARIAAVLAEIDFRMGRGPEGIARLERALETLTAEEPDADIALVAAQLGRFLTLDGQHELAAPRLELALQLAEVLELPEVLAQALTSKAMLIMRANRLEETRILLEGALAIALANDLPPAAIRAINNLAVAHESADRYGAAVDATDRGLELARRVGDRVWESQFLSGPISALVLLGRWEEAFARAAETENVLSALMQEHDFLTTHLVEIDCARGNVGEARARLGLIVKPRGFVDVQERTSFLLHEALVLRTEGKPRAALEAIEPVLAACDELGMMFLTVKLGFVEALEAASELGATGKVEELLGMIEALRPGERPPLLDAHVARFRSKLSGEEAGFKTAASRFRELELPFWLAVTELEHAEGLAAGGRAAEAEPLLAEAREIFERLEATPWLERAVRASGVGQPAEAAL